MKPEDQSHLSGWGHPPHFDIHPGSPWRSSRLTTSRPQLPGWGGGGHRGGPSLSTSCAFLGCFFRVPNHIFLGVPYFDNSFYLWPLGQADSDASWCQVSSPHLGGALERFAERRGKNQDAGVSSRVVFLFFSSRFFKSEVALTWWLGLVVWEFVVLACTCYRGSHC